MRFNLPILADHLSDYCPAFINSYSMELKLKYVFMMEKNTQCEEHAVYIFSKGKEEFLKKQDDNKELSFIIIGTGFSEEYSVQIDSFSKNWHFLTLHTKSQIKTVFQKIITAVNNLNDWYENLTEIILCQKDIQMQMDLAVQYLKNPLALFDMSMSLITWAGKMPETIQDPVWENVLKQGYNTLETFPLETRRQVLDSVGEDNVIIAPAMDMPHVKHNMVATLYHNGLPFACMAMNELNQPFDDAEYSYMVIIKKLLEQSPVLLRNIVLAKDKGSKIFFRLLRGLSIDEAQMSMFLREHGWKTDDEITVVIFRYAQDDKMNENSYRSHINTLKKVLPDIELFYYESSLVAVERNRSEESILHRLNKIEKQLAIPIGVSMCFLGYEHLHEAYLQAQISWNYTEGHVGYKRFQDIFFCYVLDVLSTNGNITYLCHPALLKFDLENEWEKELLNTLYLYLKMGKRISSTADELHIHRNTLVNRLRLIDEKLKFKIDELDRNKEQLVYISCMILCRDKI